MSIFFIWYTVYAVLYRNTSHVVLAGQNIHLGFSRPFWTPSPGFLPSGFRVNSLIFPRGKTTRHPVVFIDVRRAKNEDRLIGVSMLHNLEMCPSSSCFFFFCHFPHGAHWHFLKILFCAVTCVKRYTCNHVEISLFLPFFYSPLRMRRCETLIDTWLSGQTARLFLTRDKTGSTDPGSGVGPASVWCALAAG